MTKRWLCFDYLRVFGMFLVMWPHLGYNLNPNWFAALCIQKYVTTPLKINENFGFFGVCIFFMISGFLLPNEESSYIFIKKKFIRIFLVYWVELFVFFVVQKIFGIIFFQTYWDRFNIWDWIKSGILYNYFFGGGAELVNGVTWYLAVMVLLYLFECIRKCLRLKPGYMVFLTNIGLIVLYEIVDVMKYPFLALLPYMSIIFSGILIRQFVNKQIKIKTFGVSFFINYISMVCGFLKYLPEKYNDGYLVSVCYAAAVFSGCLLLEESFKNNIWIHRLSAISYSFYLLHSLYGGMIISWSISMNIPYTMAFVEGLGISVFMAWLNWLLLERNLMTRVRN